MSKGADLRFRHATELLVKLTRTVADFARQESELTSVLSARSRQEIRRHREEAHKVDTALEVELAEVESVAAKRAERVHAICDHRLGRVQRAHGLLTRTLPKRAADAKGNWLAKLQMRKLTADRELAANTKRNDGEHAALSQTLAQHGAVLDLIAAQAKSAFSGYGSFAQTLVERDAEKQSAEASEDFLGEIEARIAAANEQLAKFRSLPLPRLFVAALDRGCGRGCAARRGLRRGVRERKKWRAGRGGAHGCFDSRCISGAARGPRGGGLAIQGRAETHPGRIRRHLRGRGCEVDGG